MFQKKSLVIYSLLALVLFLFRTWFGIQVNFCHQDYEQIYLIGLEYAYLDGWSYWGPDVVWSQTRLAGALQSILAGLPLLLSKNYLSPIFFSNLISFLGLLLISLYSAYRLQINKFFALFFVSTLPFLVHHGSVLLNTAYLLFPGALFMIAVLELFLYRDKLLLQKVYWYFFAMGFCVFFVYQLHLTWVTILPFIVVLFVLELIRKEANWRKMLIFTFMGLLFSSLTLLPTLFFKYSFILKGMSDNLIFKPDRIVRSFEIFTRYLGYTTYDVSTNFDFYGLASDKSKLVLILLYTLKIIGVFQFIAIVVAFVFARKELLAKKMALLFVLTILMCVFLYIMSNKHLESRTYILLFGLTVYMALYAMSMVKDKKWFYPTMYSLMALMSCTLFLVGFYNMNDRYSFQHHKYRIEKAIYTKNPKNFALRRITKMDE